jgi:hypothetical protein
MLETTHKSADAYNSFSNRLREKEFDRSGDQFFVAKIAM